MLSDASPRARSLSTGQLSCIPSISGGRETEMPVGVGSAVMDGSTESVGDADGIVNGLSDGLLDKPSSVGNPVTEGSNENVGWRVGPDGSEGTDGVDGINGSEGDDGMSTGSDDGTDRSDGDDGMSTG